MATLHDPQVRSRSQRSCARPIVSAVARSITLTLACVACASQPGRVVESSPPPANAVERPAVPATTPPPPTESAPCPGAVPAGTSDAMRADAPADVGAIPAYAHVNASGLASCVVRPGRGGAFPRPDDRVSVQYVGWSTSGVVFDSSLQRGRPATFPLRAVIAGWTEGVGMMTPGEIRRLWIPEALAYRGRPGRPGGMLIFDVELIAIEPSTN